MFRYFCSDDKIQNDRVSVVGGDARHLKTILRAKVGDIISIVTECHEFTAKISDMDEDDIICEIIDEIETSNETKINITLCQGIPKLTKMETIIQQNVELGVKRFIPLITERTVVKLKDKDRELKKLERWKKIAKESAKQSKRNIVPTVENITTVKELCKQLKSEDAEIIVPYELEDMKLLKEVLMEPKENYYIIIGPEGGFDIKEIEMFKELGAQIVTLGKRILRTETAGLVASTVVLYERDEMV
jgi:16S rRNA (uracil1498-N3)-methyltransferase